MFSIAPALAAQTYQHIGFSAPAEISGRQGENSDLVPPVQPISESVDVSREGQALSQRSALDENDTAEENKNVTGQNESDETDADSEESIARELKSRDREVRAHEQAHLAAAGQYASGGATFTYQRGPDGRLYAIGGEVAIDLSRESTPEATITKMQAIRRAALAPANPSGADRQVAAQATARLAEAQREYQAEQLGNIELPSPVTQPQTNQAQNEAEEPASNVTGAIANNRRILMAETYQAVNELL